MSFATDVICTTKRVTGEGDNRQASLSFSVDYTNERTPEWATATPSLGITMTVNGKVADQIQQGQHFTVTFENNDVTDVRTAEQREADNGVVAEHDQVEPATTAEQEEPQP